MRLLPKADLRALVALVTLCVVMIVAESLKHLGLSENTAGINAEKYCDCDCYMLDAYVNVKKLNSFK